MRKYKITIDFESTTLEVDAENEKDAKNKGYEKYNSMLENNKVDKTPNHWVAEIEEDEGADLLLTVTSFNIILSKMLGGDELDLYAPPINEFRCDMFEISKKDNGFFIIRNNSNKHLDAFTNIEEIIKSELDLVVNLKKNNLYSYAYENHKLKQWIK